MVSRPFFKGEGFGFHQVAGWQLALAMVLRFVAVLLIIAAIVYLVRQLLLHRARTTPPAAPLRSPGLDELDMRYARGEVTRSEYLERRADLMGMAPPPPAPPAPADA
ncbi:MAG TPA: SHOCT domain-containing protein [Candidatus Dormibacteraeota bacterium]|jgi:uncharacterized membrane protein|nr:SHOCT domain-containing protein [Candidatus Dormibacteraeota bacterium]